MHAIRPRWWMTSIVFALFAPGLRAQCAPTWITESDSQAIVDGNSFACLDPFSGFTYETHYTRAYDLTAFGIVGAFAVCEVEVGVEVALAVDESQPLTVALYWAPTGTFPGGTLTPIGTSTVTIPDLVQAIVTVPVTGTAPPGTDLVVDVAPSDGNATLSAFASDRTPPARRRPATSRRPTAGTRHRRISRSSDSPTCTSSSMSAARRSSPPSPPPPSGRRALGQCRVQLERRLEAGENGPDRDLVDESGGGDALLAHGARPELHGPERPHVHHCRRGCRLRHDRPARDEQLPRRDGLLLRAPGHGHPAAAALGCDVRRKRHHDASRGGRAAVSHLDTARGESFPDVTTANPFYSFIETIFHKGVTAVARAATTARPAA